MSRRSTGLAMLALVGGSSPSLLAASAAQWATAEEFARPHQGVDIGGRKMGLYCSGRGATTVVFDAPSGEAGWNWFSVQPAVAKRRRACVVDRAGLGFSDPAKRPNTSGLLVSHQRILFRASKNAALEANFDSGGSTKSFGKTTSRASWRIKWRCTVSTTSSRSN